MLVKVVAVQAEMGRPLTLDQKILIFKHRPDFVCLPEYWLLDELVTDYRRAAARLHEYTAYLSALSEELSTCLIGGTVVEPVGSRLYNTSIMFDHGIEVARYHKRYPVAGELHKGISPGEGGPVIEIGGTRIGLMICGDVFYSELYREQGEQSADIIFIPTTSPYREDDTIPRKQERDQIYFVSGAALAGAYVCKTCGVGLIFGHPLQGRSLIAAPWGVLKRVEYHLESEMQILSATLDIEEIREFRRRMRQAGKEKPPPQRQGSH